MVRDKRTGIELIIEERKDQIEKHGFSVDNDTYYSKGELIQAALFCANPEFFSWPNQWDEHFKDKILNKDRIGQLKCGGAFFAAEIDRIRHEEQMDIDNDPKAFE